MTLSAPDLALWRSPLYSAYYWAYAHSPATVLAGRLNMASVTYPCTVITFDGVTTGAYTDLKEEMLLLVGTAAGLDDLGRQRIHANAAGVVATSTTINIGRSSQGTRDGELDLQNDAYITVLNLRPVMAAPPWIDATTDPDDAVTYKDGILAFNATTYFKPVVNLGVDRLVVVDTAVSTADLVFSVVAYITHPLASGTPTVLWDIADGTLISGTLTSTSITVRYGVTANDRYIGCTATDSLGNTQSGWRLVAVKDKAHANLISKFTIARHKQGIDGQDVQLRVDGPLPYSTYPDGTEILVAQRERYNGATVGSLTGYADAENMAFAGWLQSEQNTGDATRRGFIGRATLTLADTAGRLKTLPGFPQTVERKTEPTRWEQMQASNIDRYLYYLLKWHSNVLTRADFTWSTTLETYAFPTLGSDGASLYDQADLRCQAIAYRLTCNKHGQLAMKPDPLLMPTAAQASTYSLPAARTTTVIVPISEADWMNYGYAYTRPPRVHWNRGECIAVSTSDADDLADIGTFFAVAPGLAPGQGVSGQISGQQLAISQNELNVREGNRYAARMNAREGYFEVEIRPGDVIDPANMVWVQFAITAVTAGVRGRTYLSERFLPIELRHTYNPRKGLRTTKATLEREVSGIPAVLDPQPTVPITTYPPVTIQPPITVPVISPVGYPPWGGVDVLPTELIVFDSGAASCHVALAYDPALSALVYTNASSGLTGVNHWATGDAWDWGRFLAMQSTGLYASPAPFDLAPFVLLKDNATLFGASNRVGRDIQTSINRNGYFATLCGTHYIYTEDNWATFNDVDILGGAGSYQTALGVWHTFAISPYNSGSQGWIYALIRNGGADNRLYRSEDWGATWTLIGTNSYFTNLDIPYIRTDGVTPNSNDSAQEIYAGGHFANEEVVYLSQDAGGTWPILSYGDYGGAGYNRITGSITGHNWMSFTYDGRRLTMPLGAVTDAGWMISNARGTDHLAPATFYSPFTGSSVPASSGHANRFPTHSQASLYFNRGLSDFYATVDDGVTVKTLALPVGYTGGGNVQWSLRNSG